MFKKFILISVVSIMIAVCAKSGSAQGGKTEKEFNVIEGLNIDAKTPNRIRGELKTDVKNVAKFDITFDIGTASECLSRAYQCGE